MVNRRNGINPTKKIFRNHLFDKTLETTERVCEIMRERMLLRISIFFQILYKLTFADIKQYVYKLIKLIIDSSLYTLE